MLDTQKQFLKQVRDYARTHTHRETIKWLIALHGEENMGPGEAEEVLQELDYALDNDLLD